MRARSLSVCGGRIARLIGGNISTRAGAPGAREPEIVGPRGPGEPPTRRVYRHDTPHGGFFSLRARVRLRRPVRLVAPKGAVQWGRSVPSRSKGRWGGRWARRVGCVVGDLGGCLRRTCDAAPVPRRCRGHVRALRWRCDPQTRVFHAARATGAPILGGICHFGNFCGFARWILLEKKSTKATTKRR